ncbi:MAG TPA: hypothetical protein VKP88_04255 [Candidatus Paceibacterota bacterium]|nr:hypothetical protein [Candidatus Paceibacterota bacterium]
MASTVFDVLKQKITEQISDTETYLSGGGPKNFPEYTRCVGRIESLQQVLGDVKQLEKSYIEDDDDE